LLDAALALTIGFVGHLDRRTLVAAETALGVAGGVLLAMHRRRHGDVSHGTDVAAFSATEQLLVATIAALAAALLIDVARTPITDYDSLLYHLTAVAEFVQHHSFGTWPHEDELWYIGRYPYGWEALSTLFVIPFGDDFLVALPNLVALTVYGLAAYLLCRDLGARRYAALAAVVLLVSIPVVTGLVVTLHVDLAVAAFFLAALYFAGALARARSAGDLVLFLAALALVVGVKISGIVYGGVVVVACSVLALRGGRHRTSEEARCGAEVVSAVIVGFAAVWFAAFWYARNLVQVANPIGVLEVKIGGVILFPGSLDAEHLRRTTLLSCFDVRSLADWNVALRVVTTHLGLPFAGLVALAACYRPAALKSERSRIRLCRMTTALLIVTAALYCVTPFSGDNGNRGFRVTSWIAQGLRFGLPFVGMLAIAAGLGATWLSIRQGVFPSVVAGIIALYVARMSSARWLALLFYFGVAAWEVAGRRPPRRNAIASLVLATLVLLGGAYLHDRRTGERLQTYGGTARFVDTRIGRDEVIGNLLDRQPYLLYGRSLDRTVVRVPPGTDGFDAWVAQLRERRIRWLAVGPLSTRWSRLQSTVPQLQWIAEHGRLFTRVHGRDVNTQTVFYRFDDDRS